METNTATKAEVSQGWTWGFAICWVIATTCAFQLGYITGQWLLIGPFLGIAQGIVLLNWRIRSIFLGWILASSVGWAAGLAAVFTFGSVLSNLEIGNNSGSISGLLISSLVNGPLLGFSQWLILRGQVNGSGWWVISTTFGYAFGLMIALISVAGELGLYSPYLGGATGLLFGTVTGITLMLLLYPKKTLTTLTYSVLVLVGSLFIVASPLYSNISQDPFRPEPSIVELPLPPNAQQVSVFEARDASFAATTRHMKTFETNDRPEAVRMFYESKLGSQGFVLNHETSDELQFIWSNGEGSQAVQFLLTVRTMATKAANTSVELALSRL
jgi:hypothetical protein